MGLDEFHSRLMDEALNILPYVTKEDLKPYLFRSRAASAYDAIILLARSVNFVLVKIVMKTALTGTTLFTEFWKSS